AAETRDPPAVVARPGQNRPSAAERSEMLVADPLLRQRGGQRPRPVLRMPPRTREPAHVRYLLDLGDTQQREELLDGMRRMPDGEHRTMVPDEGARRPTGRPRPPDARATTRASGSPRRPGGGPARPGPPSPQ